MQAVSDQGENLMTMSSPPAWPDMELLSCALFVRYTSIRMILRGCREGVGRWIREATV